MQIYYLLAKIVNRNWNTMVKIFKNKIDLELPVSI